MSDLNISKIPKGMIRIQCGRCTLIMDALPPPAYNKEFYVTCVTCNSRNKVSSPAGSHINDSNLNMLTSQSPQSRDGTTSNKKALFVGINYKHSRRELKGSGYSAMKMKKLLVNTFGWPDNTNSIRMLTDDEPSLLSYPTRANILDSLYWLSTNVKPGDVLFLYYCGLSGRVLDTYCNSENGLSECILPGISL
jgi:hypothetical protein